MSKRDRRPDAPRHVTTPHLRAIQPPALRTASGREVHNGDTVTADDPIVLPAVDGTVGKLSIGIAPPPGAWWNNIRRAWMVGPVEAPTLVDPQPPAPSPVAEAIGIINDVVPDIRRDFLPPAVKVTA